jgi:hypothetical protein
MVDYWETRILSIATVPVEPALGGLVGTGAYVGFRKQVEEMLPGEVSSHSVRWQLLDDFPAAVMANGRSLKAEGRAMSKVRKERNAPLSIGICAGWAEGGTLLAGLTDLGPPLEVGPMAPALAVEDDTLGWHDLPVLTAHGTRRARRMDLWEEEGRAWADCFFRDSHVDRYGVETVVHEWRLLATIDVGQRCFVSVDAMSGPLPYPECPASGNSAARLEGMSIDGLRRAVRKGFTGPSTCTHLNDSFRAMEDVGALLDRLRKGAGQQDILA